MRLLIKGRPANAKRAAARHGVPVDHCEYDGRGGNNYTACHAPEKARRRVMEWFGQKETKRAGRGWPPGALVHFNGARRKRRRR